jgi:hypothetical protein
MAKRKKSRPSQIEEKRKKRKDTQTEREEVGNYEQMKIPMRPEASRKIESD